VDEWVIAIGPAPRDCTTILETLAPSLREPIQMRIMGPIRKSGPCRGSAPLKVSVRPMNSYGTIEH
jgi:hypothetical protein